MNNAPAQDLIERLAHLMARQRSSLETSDFDSLAVLLPECEQALADLQAYPGGIDALGRELGQLPHPQRDDLRAKLERANVDHRIGRDLIGLAMQRTAAMQGFAAAQNESATYSEDGGVSQAAGSLLSRKV